MNREASPAVDTSVAGPSDIFAALREVLKSALIANGLIRGLNQCVKVLDK
jgi:ribosomal protein L7Ae-like RNA K-turn-binding protein